jgi:hypothetical protein
MVEICEVLESEIRKVLESGNCEVLERKPQVSGDFHEQGIRGSGRTQVKDVTSKV